VQACFDNSLPWLLQDISLRADCRHGHNALPVELMMEAKLIYTQPNAHKGKKLTVFSGLVLLDELISVTQIFTQRAIRKKRVEADGRTD
jgi:hypothetical protein